MLPRAELRAVLEQGSMTTKRKARLMAKVIARVIIQTLMHKTRIARRA
ncbi:hypothetical protein CFL01nite_17110 [Corynebacterium flavescens]|uniref:Transposase n=1 Tax=Corynebacterium flavescens TaxID=28028 RepID=A0AB73B8E7_CORFL|nr:hypothetical protein CFL01nite_17110 [Corynebacterium flavescens]